MNNLYCFVANWCGPCQTVKPVLEKLARDFPGKVSFFDVDDEESKILIEDYGIRSVPTIVIVDVDNGFKELTRANSGARYEDLASYLR